MLILGLLGMYFDAAVVFVTSQTLLLKLAVARLAVAILCLISAKTTFYLRQIEVLKYVFFLHKDLKTDLAKIDCHKNTKMALELEFEFAFGSYDDRTISAFFGTRYQPKVYF